MTGNRQGKAVKKMAQGMENKFNSIGKP